MGNNCTGGGQVYITAASIAKAQDELGIADLVEDLYDRGFEEVKMDSEGNIHELSFEYGGGWWAQKFLHEKLPPYVEPGSCFVWYDCDDQAWKVEDFGHPERVAVAWDSAGANAQTLGARAWTVLKAASTLDVAIAQPLDDSGEPLETEFTLELTLPDGTRTEWCGAATQLYDLLKQGQAKR